MRFCKMNGLGNDYIFVDRRKQEVLPNAEEIRSICNRNFGIGGDGVVFIDNSLLAEAKMTIYNSDGSRAEMCGNALRCVARYLADIEKKYNCDIAIDTDDGIKIATVLSDKVSVRAKIGECKFAGKNRLNCGNKGIDAYSFCIGNPHAVVFDSEFDIEKYGRFVSENDLFPHRTNVEVVQIIDRNNINVRVYERGAGFTLACGTGAAAAAYASMLLCAVDGKVNVHLPGGKLYVENDDGIMTITGRTDYNYIGNTEVIYGKTQ